jgi:hypothetical protein
MQEYACISQAEKVGTGQFACDNLSFLGEER